MNKKLINLLFIFSLFQIFLITLFAQAEPKAELVVRTGHNSYVTSVAFSPDGKIMASASGNDRIKLWDVASGQELRTLPAFGISDNSLVFSPDGKLLASGSLEALPRLWEVESGRELPPVSDEFELVSEELAGFGTLKVPKLRASNTLGVSHSELPSSPSVAFSPDGKIIASGTLLFDVAKRKIIGSLNGHTSVVKSLAFSPDGKTIVSGNSDGTLKIWDAASGQEIRTLSGHKQELTSVKFSPDGKIIASGSRDNTIKIWDAASGNEIRTLSEPDMSFIESVAFSPDGKTIASGGQYDKVKIWNIADGKKIRAFDKSASSVAFSPDGKIIALANFNKTVTIADVPSGREIRILTGHTDSVASVAFSKDGKSIAATTGEGGSIGSSSAYGHRITIWNTETTPVLQVFPVKHSTPTEVFEREQVLKTEKDKYFHDFGDILGDAGTTSQFGNFKLQIDFYGTLNLLDKRNDKLLASLIQLDENDWAVVTPSGLFDASPDARKLMHFIVGFETVSLEQMKDVYYVPGLLRKIINGEPLPNVELFSKKDLFPVVEFTPPISGQKDFTAKVINRGGGIGRVQVLVNGKEFVADARPKGFNQNAKEAIININLTGAPLISDGENKIEVIAGNAAGSLTNRGTARSGLAVKNIIADNSAKETPNIYIIAGGVSDYTGDGLDLNFAAKDAEDFARAAELGAIALLGDKSKVHVRLLSGGGSAEKVSFNAADSKVSAATKKEFQQAFADFSKATANDVFIVYFAGHGVSLDINETANQAGGDTYLYLTQEATTTDSTVLRVKQSREAMTISSDEIKDLMKQNKALKQVLILDTCASGQAAETFVAKRNLPSDQVRAIERLKDNTGFYILMGSAANAVSYEASEYGQGLLTYSLLQGMKGVALDNNDANIGKLFEYAVKTVPDLAKNIGGIQQPRIITPDQSRDFPIGRFTTAERGKIPLANPKPLIVNPNLFNPKAKRDDLKLSKTMADQFRELNFASARGGQTSFVFVEADEMSGAFEPSGTYSVEGDVLKISLIVTKNGKQIGDEIVVTGNVGEKQNLIKTLVAKIIETAKP